jgi:hypothetical protein
VVGFSAFLAGFLQGGNGFNSYYNNTNTNNNSQQHTYWQANPPGGLTHDVVHVSANSSTGLWPHGIDAGLPFGLTFPNFNLQQFNLNFVNSLSGVFILFICFFVLLFVLLIYWLGARGQFLFIDNVVRNRGAISWPWTYYARQGNSLFFFYLLTILVVIVGVVMAIPLFQHSRWPVGGELAVFIILGLAYLAIVLAFSVVLFVFREMGVPLMFRNGLMAREAFVKSMRLIATYPGSITLFILLRIAIFVAVAIVSIIACCLTCCIEAIPYLGTVILLPALVFVRCFSLDCLAQFGPEYDVWTVDVPPSDPGFGATIPSFTPPPPPG